ncbi:hypothetical protein, conserved [Leishmania tarentolae]|uniref:Uncharacterized protein n=1 Tax=Leishmania tarentolae TaxID=5689 RepID=A0A640KB48_LEITA|nr:hypothetical protein, conserved [Leishmania tarentolae]
MFAGLSTCNSSGEPWHCHGAPAHTHTHTHTHFSVHSHAASAGATARVYPYGWCSAYLVLFPAIPHALPLFPACVFCVHTPSSPSPTPPSLGPTTHLNTYNSKRRTCGKAELTRRGTSSEKGQQLKWPARTSFDKSTVMHFRGVTVLRAARRPYPHVAITGRCFLLKPRQHVLLEMQSQHDSLSLLNDMECMELTPSESGTIKRRGALPASLAGNSYYARRYSTHGGTRRGTSGATESHVRFRNGDLVLRLCLSAVSRELSHKRIVDVTGIQTSFHNASERHSRALATVEEAVQTMHLHDGHEVPALQRGDVNLVRLQPKCVYISPPLSHSAAAGEVAVVDLRHLSSALRPLSNPDVLLAQARRLSFRSEMEAVQTAQVMASFVTELRGGDDVHGGYGSCAGASSAAAVLRPVVRDGHLVAMTLCPPRDTTRGFRRR